MATTTPEQGAEGASPAAFGPDWLVRRAFRFEASRPQRVIAPAVRFLANGLISGHTNVNEAAWRIVEGQLVILRLDGEPSCVASPHLAEDGRLSLVGPYLFEAGVEHGFHEIEPKAGRADVFSFGLFDTLVARRCQDPTVIFRAVEEKSGTADFARQRQAVESRLWAAGDYDLNAIYAALGEATGWPQAGLDLLRSLELIEEWDNLFPIAEMVARVGPDDVIVSDTYLPAGFLRRLIDQTLGLPGRPLYVSSHGKRRGEIWSRLEGTHRILRHHGDDPEADVRLPAEAGLQTERVLAAAWTPAEATLCRVGLTAQALAIREARLRYVAPDLVHLNAARVQFELNLPLLLLASIDVLVHAEARDIDTILLCTRDCHLWVRLMRHLAARWRPIPTVRYIFASRELLLSGGQTYENYFAGAAGRRTLVVDLSGTGREPSHFIGESGRQALAELYLIARGDDVAPAIDAIAPARADVNVRTLKSGMGPERAIIDAFNRPLRGRTLRLVEIPEGYEAHAVPNEFGPASRAFIEAMQLAFMAGLDAIVRHAVTVPADMPAEVLQTAGAEVLSLAPAFGWAARPMLADMLRGEGFLVATGHAERVREDPADAPAGAGIVT